VQGQWLKTGPLSQLFEKLKSKINPDEQEKKNKELIQRLHSQYEKQQLREAAIVSLHLS
jgi:hypothetical protein